MTGPPPLAGGLPRIEILDCRGQMQIPFYVFADVSRWTDDSYQFAFELLEKAGVGVAPGVDFG